MFKKFHLTPRSDLPQAKINPAPSTHRVDPTIAHRVYESDPFGDRPTVPGIRFDLDQLDLAWRDTLHDAPGAL